MVVILAASIVGTIPGWLTVVAVVSLAYLLTKGQLGPAIGYLREANTTLMEENRSLHNKVRELEAEKVALVARTDLEPLQAKILEQAASHEERAQGRYEATLKILDLIASRLGPDASPSREGS